MTSTIKTCPTKIMKATVNTIAELKSLLNIATLSFQEQFNQEGTSTNWAKHWLNEERVSIVAHMDTIAVLRNDPNTAVFIKESTETPEGKDPYTLYIICIPKNIVLTI